MTGGTGAAGMAASKLRLVNGPLKQLGGLFVKLAKWLKKVKLRRLVRKPRRGAPSAAPSKLADYVTDEKVPVSGSPPKNRSGANSREIGGGKSRDVTADENVPINKNRVVETTFSGKYKGKPATLDDVEVRKINYTRRDRVSLDELRKEFDSSIRKNFLKSILKKLCSSKRGSDPIMQIDTELAHNRWD